MVIHPTLTRSGQHEEQHTTSAIAKDTTAPSRKDNQQDEEISTGAKETTISQNIYQALKQPILQKPSKGPGQHTSPVVGNIAPQSKLFVV